MLLLIGVTLTRFALFSPDTARLHQVLPEVAVRVQPTVRLLQAPGESKGLYTAFGHTLLPTQRMAVWLGPPDTARTYRIRAVRVRLGSRMPKKASGLFQARRNFQEGRVQLWLSPGTRAQGPTADHNLLPQKLLLLTPDNAGEKKGWLRFDVASQRLLLPPQGLFVVAEGLTTSPTETFSRLRPLTAPPDGKTPPQDLDMRNRKLAKGEGVRVYPHVEVTRPDGSTRLISESLFPTLSYRLVTAGVTSQSWEQQPKPTLRGWLSIAKTRADQRARAAKPDANYLADYNFDLELEVEEF